MIELTESETTEAMQSGFDTIVMDLTEGPVETGWVTRQFQATGRTVRCVVDIPAKTVTIKQIVKR